MLELKNVRIAYDRELLAFDRLCFFPCEVSLLCGKSGCGKTSLLYRIAALSKDQDYTLLYEGRDILRLSLREQSDYRRYHVGFVLQEKELIPRCSVQESLYDHAQMAGRLLSDEEIGTLLEEVGLCREQAEQKTEHLSLGERQRLAIACALVKQPDILIMDEPTSSLDADHEEAICRILQKAAHERGCYVILVSHSEKVKEMADTIWQIEEGHIERIKESSHRMAARNLQPAQPLSFRQDTFAGAYGKRRKRKHSQLQRYLTLLFAVVMFLCTFVPAYLQERLAQKERQLLAPYDLQLFVSASPHQISPQEANIPFSLPHQENCYPYIRAVLHEDAKIEVVPYFDVDALADKTASYFDGAQTHGLYLSKDAYDRLYPFLNEGAWQPSIDLYEYTKETVRIHTVKLPISIEGVLHRGVENGYTEQGEAFVYVYYEDLHALYEQTCSSRQFIGYTWRAQGYSELRKMQEQLLSEGYGVNDSFVAMDVMDDTIRLDDLVHGCVSAALYGLSFLLMMAVGIRLFESSKWEWILLWINGIDIHTLLRMFVSPYIRMLMNGFVAGGTLGMTISVLAGFGQGWLLLCGVGLFSAVLIVVSLLSFYSLSHFYAETTLRIQRE